MSSEHTPPQIKDAETEDSEVLVDDDDLAIAVGSWSSPKIDGDTTPFIEKKTAKED